MSIFSENIIWKHQNDEQRAHAGGQGIFFFFARKLKYQND